MINHLTENHANWIKFAFVGAGALIGGFLGGIDGFVYTLIAFITLDYITGVTAAVKNKELSSQTGFWGLVKKLYIIALIGVANFVDEYVIGAGAVLRNAVIFFYIANEGISIMENAGKIGVKLPKKLTDVLQSLNNNK